jgi:hypothetical protein
MSTEMKIGRPKLTSEQKKIAAERRLELQRQRRKTSGRLQSKKFRLEYKRVNQLWNIDEYCGKDSANQMEEELREYLMKKRHVIQCTVKMEYYDRAEYPNVYDVVIEFAQRMDVSPRLFYYKGVIPTVTLYTELPSLFDCC